MASRKKASVSKEKRYPWLKVPTPTLRANKNCSTATGAYGKPEKKTEVPRTALMDALEARTGNRLVRSDWVAAAHEGPDPEAKKELSELPDGFTTPASSRSTTTCSRSYKGRWV
jgi:hypothetical protein